MRAVLRISNALFLTSAALMIVPDSRRYIMGGIYRKALNSTLINDNNIMPYVFNFFIKTHSYTPSSPNHALQRTIKGINFRSPIGLASGIDLNCGCPKLYTNMGLGFIDSGSCSQLSSHITQWKYNKNDNKIDYGYSLGYPINLKRNIDFYLSNNTKPNLGQPTMIGATITLSQEVVNSAPYEMEAEYIKTIDDIENVCNFYVINFPDVGKESDLIYSEERLKKLFDAIYKQINYFTGCNALRNKEFVSQFTKSDIDKSKINSPLIMIKPPDKINEKDLTKFIAV